MLLAWEHRWRSICQGRKGLIPTLARGLLWSLSSGYRTAVSFRNLAYNQGILRSKRPDNCLIISIGNLVAGGTGKTPVVIKLAEALSAHTKVAVLSRGYKSKAEHAPCSTLIESGDFAGDEPTMIAKRLPQVLVYAGKNRLQSAQMAVEAGAKILLLDDGLQHRQLARDLEVIVLDGDDPFGCGHYLPRGFLRDTPHALRRADLVIVNKPTYSIEWLRSFTTAPIVGMEIQPSGCHDFYGNPICLKNKKIGLFCGIAKPEKFRQTAQDLGATIVTEHFFPDHASFHPTKIQALAAQSQKQGADLLLCTEKDRIKLPSLPSPPLPFAWVRVNAQPTVNSIEWEQFVQKCAASFISK